MIPSSVVELDDTYYDHGNCVMCEVTLTAVTCSACSSWLCDVNGCYLPWNKGTHYATRTTHDQYSLLMNTLKYYACKHTPMDTPTLSRTGGGINPGSRVCNRNDCAPNWQCRTDGCTNNYIHHRDCFTSCSSCKCELQLRLNGNDEVASAVQCHSCLEQ